MAHLDLMYRKEANSHKTVPTHTGIAYYNVTSMLILFTAPEVYFHNALA